MDNIQVLDITYQIFQLVLKLVLPFLLVSTVVGVTIATLQVTTQIDEQTMNFVLKLLSILVMMGILRSSMFASLQDFTRQILSIITGDQLCIFTLFSLIIMRMSGATALNPVFGGTDVLPCVKAASILIISFMLYTGSGGILVHEPAVMVGYGVMFIKELLPGFTLGFGMELTFLAVRLAPAIMDYSTGFTMAQAYDPQHNARTTIIIGMYYAFMIMLFLATNRHLRLLTIFFTSCELILLEIVTSGSELVQAILFMLRESIAMGLQFAFPLIAMGLVAEAMVRILMRVIPQINVFIVNFQIRATVDILVLLFLFSPILDKLCVISNGMYQSLQQIVMPMRQEAGRK